MQSCWQVKRVGANLLKLPVGYGRANDRLGFPVIDRPWVTVHQWAVPDSHSPTSLGNRNQEKQNHLLDTRTILINKWQFFFFSFQVVGVSFASLIGWFRWLNKSFSLFQDAPGKKKELVIIPLLFHSANSSFHFLNIPPRWSRHYL